MSEKMKRIVIILAIVLGVEMISALCVVCYWRPYRKAANTMPQTGHMTLNRDLDGTLYLFWPEGVNQDRYHVQVLNGDEVLFEQWTSGAGCTLTDIPEDAYLKIVVSSGKTYRRPLSRKDRIRMGEESLIALVNLTSPQVQDLTWKADPETKTVKITFGLEQNTMGRMYQVAQDGTCTELQVLEVGDVLLTMGEGGDFPIPEGDQKLTLAFDAYRFSPGMIYYGPLTETLSIGREDLLARELELECTDDGHNVFTLTWGETKGEYYEVQQFEPVTQSWRSISRIEADQPRSYSTGHLSRHCEFRFRVVALGGQTIENSDYAAVSEEVTVTTGASLIYSTIWPIQEIELYSDPQKTETLGKVKPGKAYCILEEQEGMFKIRHGLDMGYVDSNYCMINLPDYLGELCIYDISNSNRSKFTIHEYELPSYTGKVFPGYERVQLRRGQQLVPLLYPVAQRLEKAAASAAEKGFKLKIYDAYRPQKATKALYQEIIVLKDQLLPQTTYTGATPDEMPVLTPGQMVNYGELMTNFGKTSFASLVPENKSVLNQGLGLEVALADYATGNELQAQTTIHDLSWFSAKSRNNVHTQALAAIMEGAGFTADRHQWWQFYDAAALNELKPAYLANGVTPEGWMADDQGWRYRRDDGEFYSNCTMTIEGVSYTFGELGYLVTE